MAIYSIFSQPSSPASLASDTDSYTLGMQFVLSADAALTGIWFHSASGAGSLPAACAIYDVSSQTIVSGTSNTSPSWSGSAGSGWVKCSYAGDVTLTASTGYKVVVQRGTGANWYSATANYWSSGAGASGIISGILTAPNNTSSAGGQDTFNTPSVGLTYPGSSYNANNYWIDVEVNVSGGGSSGGVSSQGAPMALFL